MLVEENIDLSTRTSWKIGGRIKYFITVNSVDELKEAISFSESEELNFVVLGRTTNILCTSDYIDGVIIKLGLGFSQLSISENTVTVGAGYFVPKLVRACINRGLGGLNHLIGVPATVGGIIAMNGGSQRKAISSHVKSVTVLDRDGQLVTRDSVDCKFSYRDSIFQDNDEIILSVNLELEFDDSKNALRQDAIKISKERNNKFPRKLPNCGSVFVSNPAMYSSFGPPGKVIEDVGLKGKLVGGAKISEQHANFIINTNSASHEDVLTLIRICIQKVKLETGYKLKSEVKFLNEKCELLRADEVI
ncbi:UDP-N-acetylmuramate dehydrogenase [Vibrio astriarenae]